MKTDLLREYVIRAEVMKLLSEEEIARINLAETPARLREGQEYLDLEQTARGVRTASWMSVPTGRVLPRDAVPASTWSRILTLVGTAANADNDGARER